MAQVCTEACQGVRPCTQAAASVLRVTRAAEGGQGLEPTPCRD